MDKLNNEDLLKICELIVTDHENTKEHIAKLLTDLDAAYTLLSDQESQYVAVIAELNKRKDARQEIPSNH